MRKNSIFSGIDWVIVMLYFVLVFAGWASIYSASLLDGEQRHIKQLIWMGFALVFGISIMLMDTKFFTIFAYLFYGVTIFFLISVLFLGKEIKGARAWFVIGSLRIQPAEFAKFATALALAKFLGTEGINLSKFRNLFQVSAILLLPISLIIIQNDTGSALVYFVFILVLFREGMHWGILFMVGLIGSLFFLALFLELHTILIVLYIATSLVFWVVNQKSKDMIVQVAIFAGSSGTLFLLNELLRLHIPLFVVLFIALIITIIAALVWAYRHRLGYVYVLIAILLGSILFSFSVNYLIDNVMEPHQKKRMNILMGIEEDLKGAGYNVHQSKIAIGSGGLFGKGYMKGTQTKFNFVPEQSTDFIFCTIGEEWGFVGTSILLLLFIALLFRIVWRAEQQRSDFSRIYGYCVASILFFHLAINIGMTIGLLPVIGIPLPFFSYGGSSLWSFTILLFIFLRLDIDREILL